MNTYFRIVIAAIILLVGWRILAPWLVSMQNDIAVWVGFGVAVLTPVLALKVWSWTAPKNDTDKPAGKPPRDIPQPKPRRKTSPTQGE